MGRHLMDLTSEVIQQVRKFQQSCLAKGDKSSISLVTSLDDKLLALTETREENVDEDAMKEMEIMTNRLQQLQSIVSKLKLLQPRSGKRLQ